jgi:hypothetical protein
MQMSIIAIQSNLKTSELSTAMSLLMFTQSLGTSIFLTISNTILDEGVRSQLGGNAEQVIAAGATGFRSIIKPQDLPAVILAYSNSVDWVFYLVAASGAMAVITAQGMGWVDVRKHQKKAPAPAATEEALEAPDEIAA